MYTVCYALRKITLPGVSNFAEYARSFANVYTPIRSPMRITHRHQMHDLRGSQRTLQRAAMTFARGLSEMNRPESSSSDRKDEP